MTRAMPRLVITNTTPIFYLYRLGYLDLFHELYQKIVVPQAVVDELKAGEAGGENVPDIRNYEWIEIRRVKVPKLIGLITDLGSGEAEALAIAMEEPDSLVIVDDCLARRIAKLQGLEITGTAGVILKAKEKGYVTSVAPLLDKLLELGFWLDKELKDRIIKLAHE